MATINVRRDVKDSFYRYKMPKITAKIEGKGNGIKTVVENMAAIARALSRPPSYPTKYLGCELGTQCNMDDKNERYIVNGDHDVVKLQDTLDGFINKFVLCQDCKNPETDIIIKNKKIEMDCKACGAKSMADMKHKLSPYIVKNPPAIASKNVRKQGKAATAQANNTGEGVDAPDAEDGNGEDDDIISQRIQKQAAGLNMESKLALEGWSEDTSDDAVAKRLKELSIKGSGAFADADEEEDDQNKYDDFGIWLMENKNKDWTDEEIIEKATQLNVLGEYKACQVLGQGLFNEAIISQIPKRAKVLKEFINNEKGQKAFLGGIERLIGIEHKDSLLKKTPTIFMKIYDVDVIEEEVFLKWGEKPSKRYVEKEVSKEIKKTAKPFLDWLELTSEEEESEEESD